MKIRRPFWVVFALGLAALGGMLLTGAVIYLRVIYLAALLLLTSWLWTYFSVRGLDIKRYSRLERQRVGQVFEEQFEIQNRWPLIRLWLEVSDQSKLPDKNGSRVISWLGPRQRRMYQSHTPLSQRGQFVLGPTVLRSGDPFGFFLAEKRFEAAQSLLVLPFSVDISHFQSPPGMLPGGRAVKRRNSEVTPQSAGVREYAAGDPLSRIHWPTTARRDKLTVKEFEQDPNADVWILIDGEEAAHFEKDASSKEKETQSWIWWKKFDFELACSTFEYALCAAASIGKYFLRRGKSLGVVCADRTMAVLSPEAGLRQLNKLFETLAHLEGKGSLSLLGLVEAQAAIIPRGSTVVLITASNNPSVVIAGESLLSRRLKPIVVCIDGLSFGQKYNNRAVVEGLKQMNIPVLTLGYREPIKQRLEMGS